MAEPITNVLGIVSIKNRGEYNSETSYEKLNVVTYQGSSYCALRDTIGNLPTNTDYWQLYAEKGGKGDTGNTGPQGPAPVKGVDYYTASDKQEIEDDLADDIATEVSSSLGSLTTATPLVASSVSGMTDTTRVYVNSTDGHWYWYNGSSWIDGGVYQATEDSDSVDILIGETGTLNTFGKYYNLCERALFDKPTYSFSPSTRRVSLTQPKYTEQPIFVVCDKDYMFGVVLWSSATKSESSFISDSGWLRSYVIPADSYYTFSVKRTDNGTMNKKEVVNCFEKKFNITDDISYNQKDVLEFKNGIETFRDYNTFISAGLKSGDFVYNSSTDCSSYNIMKFDRDLHLTVKDGYRFGIHTYINGVFNSDSGWKTDTYTVPKNTEFRIVIAKAGNTVPSDTNFFVSKVYFPTIIEDRLKKLENNNKILSYNYSGEKIVLNKNVFSAKEIVNYSGSLWGNSSWAGGMSIADDVIFVGYNLGKIAAFDLNTHELIATGTSATASSDNHYNNLSFSNTIQNNNRFPLIYTSKCKSGKTDCYVEQYTINNSTITSTLVQTITYGGTEYYSSTSDYDWVIDKDNNYLYMVYYAGNSFQRFVKFNIPSLTNSNVELTDTDVLDTIDVMVDNARQGSTIYNNKIFILTGYSNQGKLWVADVNTKQHIATINIANTFSIKEPEGISVYKNKIYINMHILNDIEANIFEISTNV